MKSQPKEEQQGDIPSKISVNKQRDKQEKFTQEHDFNNFEFDEDEEEALKNQTFVEYTESQQKIWRLFKSLDCFQCTKIYNNKQRKPQIICANNHLLCKSCYSKVRQLTFLCPFCNIRMSTRNTSSHQSIQLFLKIYNQIFQKQKSIIQEKRKKSFVDFQIPKNIKTLSVLLLIIVTPWIFDALKFIVYFLVELEYKILTFFYDKISEVLNVVRIIIQDEFYINLFTNQNGDYVYYGDQAFNGLINADSPVSNATSSTNFNNLYTLKHKAKIETYMNIIMVFSYLTAKITKITKFLVAFFNIFNYCLHFVVIIIGIIQFPFLIPIILVRVQFLVPKKFRFRIALYLDLIEPEQLTEYDSIYEPDDMQRLSKGELYFFLAIRNYIQTVLGLYKSIQMDMKKRCEELEYKKRMRLLKKNPKQTATAKGSKFLSGTTSRMKFTF